MAARGIVPQEAAAVDSNTYLVIFGVDARNGGFDFMPSLRIPAEATPPAPLHRHHIPGGTCSVFRQVVRKGDIFPQVQAAREAIFARHRERAADGPPSRIAFEVYPQGLSVTPGSWIDHYFHVARSANE